MISDKDKKIIYMGTPDFAVPALTALVESGYKVIGVVTQPDKPKGRGKVMLKTPVKEEAERLGIPVWQPKKVREPEFIDLLREQKPDMIVVAAFGQIIPKAVLELPPYGCLNIHGSLLPKYRGASPIQQAIINGDEETGVTIMRMDEGLDTGDIISTKVIPLTGEETGGSLFDDISAAGAELLLETIPSVFAGTAGYTKQPAESPTPYAAMLKKEAGLLDFGKSAEELERLVRGLCPWPGAYTYLNGKTLKIWKSRVSDTDETSGTPGQILRADPSGIAVSCGSGVLVLTEVQLEGRKKMAVDAFLRGCRVEKGMMLTKPENNQ